MHGSNLFDFELLRQPEMSASGGAGGECIEAELAIEHPGQAPRDTDTELVLLDVAIGNELRTVGDRVMTCGSSDTDVDRGAIPFVIALPGDQWQRATLRLLGVCDAQPRTVRRTRERYWARVRCNHQRPTSGSTSGTKP